MASWLRTVLLATLVGLIAASLALLLQQQWQYWQRHSLPNSDVAPSAPALPPHSYADAIATAAPSVVSIRTAIASDRADGNRSVSVGLGSGVIWRQDGLVITNYHVIRQAEAIAVELHDGRTLRADLVGADPATDLALVRVNSAPLPTIVRTSQPVRVGDVALAIGYPFLLGQTVTVGIISATERLERGFIRLIQTDAAINRGNSGGALINARGEWVGINSEVLPAQLGVQGIGFAIPADYAETIVTEILNHGRVVRGSIGFIGTGSAGEIRTESSDNRLLNAVKVDQVDPNGSAAAAGLKTGDLITHFNGELIAGVTDLLRRISDTNPGQTVRMRVHRGATEVELSIVVSERAAEPVKPIER